ncbi:Cleavage and polyadenylation specificity factor subunit 1 [Cichlidogyrus casuarinus]|uniref:Cleavage and polyadenylation specificity factor subunit 1 n=1 Tax=Cichlidogyrus casuarinus TaxID=1844966 RepID=A0ABD2PSC1_9PLAT
MKIYIWTFLDNTLNGVAFVDTDMYVHQMYCMKNLIVAADMMNSVHFYRFQPDFRVLSLVSKEFSQRQLFAVNFFVDGRKMGFIC